MAVILAGSNVYCTQVSPGTGNETSCTASLWFCFEDMNIGSEMSIRTFEDTHAFLAAAGLIADP